MDSSGFYKKEEDTIFYAPNFVYAPTYTLVKEAKDQYVYPNNGWIWFDTIEEAIDIMNIQLLSFKSIDEYNINSEYFYEKSGHLPFVIVNNEIVKV